jgi:hypothetical protein
MTLCFLSSLHVSKEENSKTFLPSHLNLQKKKEITAKGKPNPLRGEYMSKSSI